MGAIHVTVMNCSKVRLSSGVRSSCVGRVKAGLMSWAGSFGSRIGMHIIILMAMEARTVDNIIGSSVTLGRMRALIKTIRFDVKILMYSSKDSHGVVLGRIVHNKRISVP